MVAPPFLTMAALQQAQVSADYTGVWVPRDAAMSSLEQELRQWRVGPTPAGLFHLRETASRFRLGLVKSRALREDTREMRANLLERADGLLNAIKVPLFRYRVISRRIEAVRSRILEARRAAVAAAPSPSDVSRSSDGGLSASPIPSETTQQQASASSFPVVPFFQRMPVPSSSGSGVDLPGAGVGSVLPAAAAPTFSPHQADSPLSGAVPVGPLAPPADSAALFAMMQQLMQGERARADQARADARERERRAEAREERATARAVQDRAEAQAREERAAEAHGQLMAMIVNSMGQLQRMQVAPVAAVSDTACATAAGSSSRTSLAECRQIFDIASNKNSLLKSASSLFDILDRTCVYTHTTAKDGTKTYKSLATGLGKLFDSFHISLKDYPFSLDSETWSVALGLDVAEVDVSIYRVTAFVAANREHFNFTGGSTRVAFSEVFYPLQDALRERILDLEYQAERHVWGAWKAEDRLRFATARLLSLVAFADWAAIHTVTPEADGVLAWAALRDLDGVAASLLDAALATASRLVTKARVLSGKFLSSRSHMPTNHTAPRRAIHSFQSDEDLLMPALRPERQTSKAKRANRKPSTGRGKGRGAGGGGGRRESGSSRSRACYVCGAEGDSYHPAYECPNKHEKAAASARNSSPGGAAKGARAAKSKRSKPD